MATLPYLSLFAGAGGLDLALRLVLPEAQCIGYVEIEAPAVEILATRMAEGSLDEAPIYSDVRTFPCELYRGKVAGVIGGWPCPPVSVAGKRQGQQDERWLWAGIIRVVRQTDAQWFLGENVPGLLSANDGGAFGEVLRDLAEIGFTAEWLSLRASDVGAPHRRERVFILAQAEGDGRGEGRAEPAGQQRGLDAAERGEPVADTLSADVQQATTGGAGDTRGVATTGAGGAVEHAPNDNRGRRISSTETGTRQDGERGRRLAGTSDGLFPPGPGLGGSGVLDKIRKLYSQDTEQAWGLYQAELSNTLRWRDILEVAPWLQPALSQVQIESALRGVADELANVVVQQRTDALRAAGNGVVVLQGSLALILLMREAGLTT